MIAFSGLDGAGKSTQIELLKEHYSNSNKQVEIFWSRGGYTPCMEWFKSLLRKVKFSEIPKERGQSKQRDQAFSSNRVRWIWLTLAILDLMWYYGVVLRWKSLFKIVICDRYLLDTQIDFDLNFPDDKVSERILWKALTLISVKPAYHFILTIPVEESQRRSLLKDEPFPDSANVLEHRLSQYLEYIKMNKYSHHIDCMKPMELVADQIKSILSR
jgi:thymidylate kinase